MDWSTILRDDDRQPGASAATLATFARDLTAPLTADERAELRRMQAYFSPDSTHTEDLDPSTWAIPSRPLPRSYLSLLAWSNGGIFEPRRDGSDLYVRLLSTDEVRNRMIDYWLPLRMPGIVPFATDVGDYLYGFDMREPAVAGEYPILEIEMGALDFDEAVLRTTSLPTFFDPDEWVPHQLWLLTSSEHQGAALTNALIGVWRSEGLEAMVREQTESASDDSTPSPLPPREWYIEFLPDGTIRQSIGSEWQINLQLQVRPRYRTILYRAEGDLLPPHGQTMRIKVTWIGDRIRLDPVPGFGGRAVMLERVH